MRRLSHSSACACSPCRRPCSGLRWAPERAAEDPLRDIDADLDHQFDAVLEEAQDLAVRFAGADSRLPKILPCDWHENVEVRVGASYI